MDFSFSNDLNFNSVEDLPGFEARAAFTVNSQSVFREDTDIVRLPKLVRQPPLGTYMLEKSYLRLSCSTI